MHNCYLFFPDHGKKRVIIYIFITLTDAIIVSKGEESALTVAGSGPAAAGRQAAEGGRDINHLFPSFKRDREDDEYHNISLDIEKLDITKFKNKINGEMRSKLLEEDEKIRSSESGRRFAITWFWDDGLWKYRWGYKIMINQLHCDMILQLIYMAKGQIATIENSPSVNTADTGYRAGYIGNKCLRIFKKISRILAFMKKYQYEVGTNTAHIVLHHRTVRLHIDFLYYYWVLANLDSSYRERFREKYKPRLPEGDEPTGGVSIELTEPPPPSAGKMPPGFG